MDRHGSTHLFTRHGGCRRAARREDWAWDGPTRAQASGSVLVEVGNPERDMFVFDVGSGSLANFMCLGLPINSLDKVFLSHLHADHTADLITLFGSFRKAGRKGPLRVWGGNGSEPAYGSKAAIDAIAAACAWDTESTRGFTSEEAAEMRATEFDAAITSVVHEANGVTITAFPVIHNLHGAVGYRVDFAGLSMVFSGDTHPCWPLVRAAEGTDLLIHECFPSADMLAALTGDPVERFETITATHTVPRAAGKVFSMVRPRMAGLWHTLLVPPVVAPILEQVGSTFDGAVVQTQTSRSSTSPRRPSSPVRPRRSRNPSPSRANRRSSRRTVSARHRRSGGRTPSSTTRTDAPLSIGALRDPERRPSLDHHGPHTPTAPGSARVAGQGLLRTRWAILGSNQ